MDGVEFGKFISKSPASEARQKMLFIAEQVVDFFGIGLPIVHDWRFWFMPIVDNKNIHNLGVFMALKSTPSNYL